MPTALAHRLSIMRIRTALRSDCEALSRIAYAAKGHWGYPAAWLEEWVPELAITARTLQELEVVLAEIEGTIAGFYGVSIEGLRAGLDNLWVDPQHMGRGIGRALFRHAVDLARGYGAELLEIESDPFAEPFYRRMGAVPVGIVERPVCGQPRKLPVLHLVLDAGASPEAAKTEEDP